MTLSESTLDKALQKIRELENERDRLQIDVDLLQDQVRGFEEMETASDKARKILDMLMMQKRRKESEVNGEH